MSLAPKPKIDPTKLRLFSVQKRSLSSGSAASAPGSRCASSDSKKPTAAVANTPGSSAASSRPSLFTRESSKASSSLTKRSVSSEDARRLMKEKMMKAPDIAPVRGGNINIDTVTPAFVEEFWTKKKIEADAIKERLKLRHTVNAASSAVAATSAQHSDVAVDSQQQSGAQQAAAVGAQARPHQPLRGLRPAATASAISAKPAATGSRSNSASQKEPVLKKRSVSPAHDRLAPSAAAIKPTAMNPRGVNSIPHTKPNIITRAPPHPSTVPAAQPVARRLLVGSAAIPSTSTKVLSPQAAAGTAAGTAAGRAAPQPALKKGTATTAISKRVHIDPTIAAGQAEQAAASTIALAEAAAVEAATPPSKLSCSNGVSLEGSSTRASSQSLHDEKRVDADLVAVTAHEASEREESLRKDLEPVISSAATAPPLRCN